MLFKKKKSRITRIIEEIEKKLSERKFSEAMSKYLDLENEYSRLYKEAKEHYKEPYKKTKNKLLILMKIREILALVKTDNLELLKEKLTDLSDLVNSQPDLPERFLTYIQHHYDQSLKAYYYKLHNHQLDLILEEIYAKLAEENYEEALSLFPELMHQFNEMSKYHRNEKLLAELEELKSHIKVSLLKKHAFSEPAKINTRKIKQQLKKGKLWKEFSIRKTNSKKQTEIPEIKPDQADFPDISTLKELIKKNEHLKAKLALDSLLPN